MLLLGAFNRVLIQGSLRDLGIQKSDNTPVFLKVLLTSPLRDLVIQKSEKLKNCGLEETVV